MSKESEEETKVLSGENDATTVVSQRTLASQSTSSLSLQSLSEFYTIKSKIASGGMGVVYLARDNSLNRYVAVKRLKPQWLSDESIRRRFLHEAKAVALLNNAYIVHIYFVGEDSDGPYIVMEYVESALSLGNSDVGSPRPSQTLEQYVGLNGVFDTNTAINFMLKVCNAVSAAHAGGVIHRDLKPANILMDQAGSPKIVDFGLARIKREDILGSNITVKGDKFISLGYGAPEQEQDASQTDERADIYGLGAVFYYILSGKNPRYFREEDVPESLRPVICKALATDKTQRWNSVEELNNSLLEIVSGAKKENITIKTTWRCKWCDAVNPLTTHYCGGCGWDGGTHCIECGNPMFFGMHFCNICGANARTYEQADSLLELMKKYLENHEYDKVVECSEKPLNLEPVGPNGRNLLSAITDCAKEAAKRISRKHDLKEFISMEIKAENFERAERYIKEFRQLSSNKEVFAEELSSFPLLIQKRDLARVRKAFSSRDWEYGEKILSTVTHPDSQLYSEWASLCKCLRRHKKLKWLRFAPIPVLVILLYILTIPLGVKYFPQGVSVVVWKPAYFLSKAIGCGSLLDKYAISINAPTFEDVLKNGTTTSIDDKEVPHDVLSADASKEINDIRQSIIKLQQSYRLDYEAYEIKWREDYEKLINELATTCQNELDMTGWMSARDEISRFKKEKEIPSKFSDSSASKLVELQKRVRSERDLYQVTVARSFVAETKKMLEILDAKTKAAMSSNKMLEAEAFYKLAYEIKDYNDFKKADKFLNEFSLSHPEFALVSTLGDTSIDMNDINPVENERKYYEHKVAEINEEIRNKNESVFSNYRESIISQRDICQRQGDFDGVSIAQRELERFDQTKSFSSVSDNEPDWLVKARGKFEKQKDGNEKMYAEKLVSISDEYISRLNKIIEENTKANNLRAASIASSEKKRILSLVDVNEARNRIVPQK